MSPNISAVRSDLPAVLTSTYLNTGSYGPLSRAAATAIEKESRQQLEIGRLSSMGESGQSIGASLRAGFARVFGCESDEVALTHHTTDGMNIATWGVQYRPGDEIVTNTWEHPGGLLPVYAAARRFGLKVRMVSLNKEDDEETILAKFDRVIGPRTKLVSVAHVSWKTGTILPIDRLARLVHLQGGLLAVDGAQSGGAIRLDMSSSGADFYAIPGQKWLCGPEGIGALYVNREQFGELLQTYVGYPSLRDGGAYDETGIFLPPHGANRYEVGTTYRPAMAGMLSGLHWLEELGLDWVYERTQKVTQLTREVLSAIPAVRMLHTPTHAGLTSFTIDGITTTAAVERLAEAGVLVRSVPDPDLVRVSSHFFNDENDIDKLRAGIEGLNA
ncbi:MAG: aminotransferase class V-fold PLP-dependent enzyme [Caldilineaceae bacterium]|nr:aminotransferase class V-fold PLP-dependent enzyme [Caldilineaceae bacterium]